MTGFNQYKFTNINTLIMRIIQLKYKNILTHMIFMKVKTVHQRICLVKTKKHECLRLYFAAVNFLRYTLGFSRKHAARITEYIA